MTLVITSTHKAEVLTEEQENHLEIASEDIPYYDHQIKLLRAQMRKLEEARTQAIRVVRNPSKEDEWEQYRRYGSLTRLGDPLAPQNSFAAHSSAPDPFLPQRVTACRPENRSRSW